MTEQNLIEPTATIDLEADPISTSEIIVTVAAHELGNKHRVFAGVGLPTLAVDLARRISNPDIDLVYESGVCGAHPTAMAEGIADSVVVSYSEAVLSMAGLFGYVLQGGYIDVGFLGAAQVDRFGSLNTTVIGDWEKPQVRLPGAGGALEIMQNAKEVFIIMRRHDRESLPEELDFCTSPSPVRAALDHKGMPPSGHGVSKVITPLAVLTRDDPLGELVLTSVHPGVTVEQVLENTGWPLKIADHVTRTELPTNHEVHLLRNEIDKVRLYLR
ncbi:glutaconate CoA-transferase subunit B [Leucobacter exalbidus]|uniref:Glutaconate CoA-transferase subunit B n=1 Tax=Leucobacter exalbidus TaxID=662960 RepID=A0A940T4U5_9MICO|nr:CoA-transferase [Leucobacter exalbidus]MBP1327318.1 glutaconate CoA-transferase subunit B [Leucobacter exalbidus]